MTGLTNYSAAIALAWLTGLSAPPALPAQWLGLFTAVGTDAGTGFTEVSGNGYARTQVAGNATTNATTASGNATLHFASTPAWIVAGMTVYDATSSAVIPAGTTVLSTTGTTVVMSANATGGGVGGTDVINFTAFPAGSGTAPMTTSNGAVITMAAATGAGWGTIISWGLYDASTVGNLCSWDFLGAFNWLPFESTSVNTGNGPVFSAKAHGYANTDPLVATAEYGGTLPTLTTGTLTGYNVFFAANVATDSFTATTTSGGTAFAATSTGSGMVRKIVQQLIPAGVTASFAANALQLTAA